MQRRFSDYDCRHDEPPRHRWKPAASLPRIAAVHPDPRTPELLIDSMPTAWEQAVTMRALCFAFPFLKICEDWTERSGRLKLELTG